MAVIVSKRIVVPNVGPSIVEFTIGSTKSQCEEGMTFKDYADSSYNTVSFDGLGTISITASNSVKIGQWYYVVKSGAYQTGSDIIEPVAYTVGA